jgi:Cu2+-exporting ATPase
VSRYRRDRDGARAQQKSPLRAAGGSADPVGEGRDDLLAAGWQIKSELPVRLRLKNPVLFRKNALCHAIERELMGVLGVDRFSTNSIICSVLVHYDPKHLNATQAIEIVGSALADAEISASRDAIDGHLAVCTASIALAATAQFVATPILPAAAALHAFTAIPTLK